MGIKVGLTEGIWVGVLDGRKVGPPVGGREKGREGVGAEEVMGGVS